jgi:phosphate:Na+ symporter
VICRWTRLDCNLLVRACFNLILALVFLPLLSPYAELLQRMFPPKIVPDDPKQPRYLDRSALESPPIALAAAAREALRMADTLEAMLTGSADALIDADRERSHKRGISTT